MGYLEEVRKSRKGICENVRGCPKEGEKWKSGRMAQRYGQNRVGEVDVEDLSSRLIKGLPKDKHTA